MNGNKKQVIDFPGGIFIVGPEDDLYVKSPKKVNFQEALAYARKFKETEGREITFEEMQRFVLS